MKHRLYFHGNIEDQILDAFEDITDDAEHDRLTDELYRAVDIWSECTGPPCERSICIEFDTEDLAGMGSAVVMRQT